MSFMDILKGAALSGGGGTPLPALPDEYTAGKCLAITAQSAAMQIPITGDIDYIVKMAFKNPAQQQLMGFTLAANAYFGINIAGDIAAEWSVNDENTHGISDVDPTDANVIKVEFRTGQRARLTVEGSEQVSLGYPGGMANYRNYTSFVAFNLPSSVAFSADIYRITIKRPNGYTKNDIVPCRRNADDALGFYDILDSVFYPVTNAALIEEV